MRAPEFAILLTESTHSAGENLIFLYFGRVYRLQTESIRDFQERTVGAISFERRFLSHPHVSQDRLLN